VLVATSVNGASGETVQVNILAYNPEMIGDTIRFIIEFDPAVVQVQPQGIRPMTRWELVGTPEIDNVLGTIIVTLREMRSKGPSGEGGLLSISFMITSEEGGDSAIIIREAVVDGNMDVSQYAIQGAIGISDKPAKPVWFLPDFIGEETVGLRWRANAEPNLIGYRVMLEGPNGEVIAVTETVNTSWRSAGLTGARGMLASLVAINGKGQSTTAELRFDTAIGPSTSPRNALFLLAEDWGRTRADRSVVGLDSLLPWAVDLVPDDHVRIDDLLSILDRVGK
jgi:hypothetical protein